MMRSVIDLEPPNSGASYRILNGNPVGGYSERRAPCSAWHRNNIVQ
ncbi:hypothetical protein ABT117_29560 [Streptomyces sp. NPDC002262]